MGEFIGGLLYTAQSTVYSSLEIFVKFLAHINCAHTCGRVTIGNQTKRSLQESTLTVLHKLLKGITLLSVTFMQARTSMEHFSQPTSCLLLHNWRAVPINSITVKVHLLSATMVPFSSVSPTADSPIFCSPFNGSCNSCHSRWRNIFWGKGSSSPALQLGSMASWGGAQHNTKHRWASCTSTCCCLSPLRWLDASPLYFVSTLSRTYVCLASWSLGL